MAMQGLRTSVLIIDEAAVFVSANAPRSAPAPRTSGTPPNDTPGLRLDTDERGGFLIPRELR